jgi:hypothetical protein
LDVRREALFELEQLEESIAEGQHQLWLDVNHYPRNVRPAIHALFDVLRD